MDYEKIKQDRKAQVIKEIDEKIAQGYLPNIKKMQQKCRELNGRARVLVRGAEIHAQDVDEVNKVNTLLAFIAGEIEAYEVYIVKFNEKLKEQ